MEHYDAYELRLYQPFKSCIASCNLAGFDNSLGNLNIHWEGRSAAAQANMVLSVPEFWWIGAAINLALRIMEQDRSIEALTEIGLSFLSTLGRGYPTAYTGGHSRSRMRLHVALFLQKLRASFVNVHVTSSVEGDAQALLNDWSPSLMEYDTKHAGVLRLNARVRFVSNSQSDAE